VLVYRVLSASGPLSAPEIALRAFPSTFGRDDPLFQTLQKRALRRTYDSLVWMRHHNAPVWAVPTPDGTIFSLVPVAVDVLAVRSSVSVRPEGALVTDEVSQPLESQPLGPQDLWHGR
jgi:hypothetical protein